MCSGPWKGGCVFPNLSFPINHHSPPTLRSLLLLLLGSLCSSLGKQRLILLLSLDEGILKLIGIFRVGEPDSQSNGFGLSLAHVGGSVPDPAPV